MKSNRVFLSLVVALSLTIASSGGAQSNGDARWSYLSVRSVLTATVRKGNDELVTLRFPAGMLVAISDGTPSPGGRNFHGTVEIRARLASDVKPPMPMAEIMREAPVVLKAQDVDVVIQNN